MSDDLPVIPFAAIFAEDDINPNPSADPRPALNAAQVVLGVDVMSGREFLVYGRQELERIGKTGKGTKLAILRIGIDQETDELERLCALMLVVKGRFDYEH